MMANDFNKYEVTLIFSEAYFVRVEAINKEEAENKAIEEWHNGNTYHTNSDFVDSTIVEINGK